jgi:hypothetical protein
LAIAQVLSPEEVRNQYVRVMGKKLGQLYDELRNELVWLHDKWREYRKLFGTSKERIDLLNKVAPFFFGYLQHTLFDDILLHLARLTDPPETGSGKNRQENLTMRRLPQLIADTTFKSKVEKLLNQVEQKCDFARKWRHKRLAHADLLTKRAPKLLPPRSRQMVEDALKAMRDLMNEIAKYYHLAPVAYESGSGGLGGADSLVFYLEKAKEAA